MKGKYIICIFLLLIGLKSFSQKLNLSLQLFGSPQVYIFKDTENEDFHQDLNYSSGGFIKNRILLKHGAISIRTGFFIDNKSYSQTFPDTIEWYPKSVQTKFFYSNIPLVVDYRFSINNKIFPFISAGFVFGHIIKQNQHWIYNNGSKSEGFGRMENEKNPKYFHCSIGFDYRLNEKLFIQFEPYMKYLLNGKSPYNYDDDSRIAIGLRVGIVYDFIVKVGAKKANEP